MQDTLDSLFQVTPSLPPKLRNVARVILDNPMLVATNSMRSLAGLCEVTPPTMIRFANALGFENYDSFREVFRSSVNEQNFETRANRLQRASAAGGLEAIVQDTSRAGLENLDHLYKHLDLEGLTRASELMLDASRVFVAAAGGMHWIAAYLHYIGRMAMPNLRLPETSGNGLVEGLVGIRADDAVLLLAYSPYSRHAIEAGQFALNRGAKLIYLTDSRAAPLAVDADVLLLQKTVSPQFFPSMVAVISMIETLVSVIVAKSGDTAIDNIGRYTEIRKHSEFYIDEPRLAGSAKKPS